MLKKDTKNISDDWTWSKDLLNSWILVILELVVFSDAMESFQLFVLFEGIGELPSVLGTCK